MCAEVFQDRATVSFILTNSRSFSPDRTCAVHQEIAENIAWAAGEAGRNFVLVSRGDSTPRSHWPLETRVLSETLARTGRRFDGEILIPFFPEGGRFTFGNMHYVKEGDTLVPAGETEFARDPAFGYASLGLTAWCQEKMGGACRAEDCICVALEDLRALRTEKILQQLTAVENFAKVIVNAACYEDLKVFCAACCEALDTGKTFLLRTAASWVKVFGGIPGKALLRRGITAVIYTTRERVTPPGVSGEEQLRLSRAISRALTSVVERLAVRPRFLVAKGGITSSDVGVKALGVKRALVLGQIAPRRSRVADGAGE